MTGNLSARVKKVGKFPLEISIWEKLQANLSHRIARGSNPVSPVFVFFILFPRKNPGGERQVMSAILLIRKFPAKLQSCRFNVTCCFLIEMLLTDSSA